MFCYWMKCFWSPKSVFLNRLLQCIAIAWAVAVLSTTFAAVQAMAACQSVSNVRVFFQLKSLGFELAWVGIVGALLQPGMLCLERLGERKRGVRLLPARAERAPSAQWYGGTRRALRPRRGPLPRGWAISPCQPLPDPLEHNSVVCVVFSDLREHSRQV